MNRIDCVHAPAAFAFRDRALVLQLLVPDDDAPVADIALILMRPEGEQRLRMLPVDGLNVGESYSVYAATVPVVALAAHDMLTYRFSRNGAQSETYRIPLLDAPELPPLLITEYGALGDESCAYLELYNTTDKALDLFDFELLCHDGVLRRQPLARTAGEHVIPARMHAAVVFADGREGKQGEKALLFSALAEKYPDTCADIAERDPMLFVMDAKAQGGNGDFDSARSVALARRGAPWEETLFSVVEDRTDPVSDDGCPCAAYWTVDMRDPAHGVPWRACTSPTPGFAAEHTFVPNSEALTVPAILPVEPTVRVYLAGGACRIRFAAVGRELAAPTVLVRIDGRFKAFCARLCDDGLFEATVPLATLARMGARLEYFIRVSGGLYTAEYGNEQAPCTLRIVDNAGPEILSSDPVEGQVLEDERSPAIRVSYYDISAINPHSSVLCVDGRNVSTAAVWGADAVTYRPKKPLALGAHVVELTLRDMLGNRTYRKVNFSISDGSDRAQENGTSKHTKARRKGIRRFARASLIPLQTVAFAARVTAALKSVLRDKHK